MMFLKKWWPLGSVYSAWQYLFNWFLWFLRRFGSPSKHFVGLKNQGATCYLNTLLQTWFMTQEVKECITSYEGQDSLICELRSLFERLSDENEWSVSTEQLTSQLNLNVSEQRDIEECFRSLLNDLNSKMDQEHDILKIYQVTMVNSLKCLECKQSMDEDTTFLDIPLSVCSANTAEKFDSVEKSLEQFLKEEKMEGDNKCYCINCEMKTDTSSRYYFKHLPQILTFQLKRFEFHYNYMAFRKITDSITVPSGLEFTRSQDIHNEWQTVNKGVDGQDDSHMDFEKDEETPVQEQEEHQGYSVNFKERNSETLEGTLEAAGTKHHHGWWAQAPAARNMMDHVGIFINSSDVFNSFSPLDRPLQVSTIQEEKRYELFAIWHHEGSYGHGHYYAEIKSDSDGWYNFNDEFVKKKMDSESSSKTAYVLMYRLIDTDHKEELPVGVSKKPVDESEKGKPVMEKLKPDCVMRMLGCVMRKLKLGCVMRMLGQVIRMLGWVMRKLMLGWVMSKTAPLPVEGENCALPVEGEDGASPGGSGKQLPSVGMGSEHPLMEGEVDRHSARQRF